MDGAPSAGCERRTPANPQSIPGWQQAQCWEGVIHVPWIGRRYSAVPDTPFAPPAAGIPAIRSGSKTSFIAEGSQGLFRRRSLNFPPRGAAPGELSRFRGPTVPISYTHWIN